MVFMLVNISTRLEQARTARGLSRRKLSLSAGLSPTLVGQIERGEVVNPGVETVVKLATKLGVGFAWLAVGDGEGPQKAAA
jgi:transcriptional regulator with XRE-family HTH domain